MPSPRPWRSARGHAHDAAERLAALDERLWTPDEPAAVAGLGELTADLHAAWDYATEHDRPLAVQLAGDVYDYAYLRQHLDLLAWGEQIVSWDMEHRALPRALAAAAASAWAGGRLDEAERHALAAGDAHPAAGHAVNQSGNIAMFKGRTDGAIARFRTAAALHRTANEHVRALMDEISVEQVRVYGGHAAEARDAMADLVSRADRTDIPSALCWAYYILGEATAATDVDRALEAYAIAIRHGRRADCELLVMLARSSSIALTVRDGPPVTALDELRRVLDEWEQLGNELSQWWVLLQLVVLLVRCGVDADAAVLAGAVLAARDRQPNFAQDTAQLTAALSTARSRLGPTTTDDLLAQGARLSRASAIAHARHAIRVAQQ